ncbi:MAG: anion transporter [Methanomassiliicoccales archaeon]
MSALPQVSIPVIILFVVFALIAVRQVGRFRLKIWQIMAFGAIGVLVTGQISPIDAIFAIDLDVMLFLFGMFVVGEALIQSGYLFYLGHKIFRTAKNTDQLVLMVLFVIGLLSAFLMNDTLAIIGTPLVLQFAAKFKISPKLMLLALAFAVTTGSVMSPIGNPQNLLIAINGKIENPFITFFTYLGIPTLINIFLCYLVLKFFYRKEFEREISNNDVISITDPRLATACKISIILIILLVMLRIGLSILGMGEEFRLTYIAIIASLPILIAGDKRIQILKNIDWHTLIFFASMFILMESVWDSEFFQSLIAQSNYDFSSLYGILIISVILSQLISNVPFVALYLPLLVEAGISEQGLMALAAGSTIAGNLLILGAASNVIIIQNAEKRGETVGFLEFAKVGIPLTAINMAVYWLFLNIL